MPRSKPGNVYITFVFYDKVYCTEILRNVIISTNEQLEKREREREREGEERKERKIETTGKYKYKVGVKWHCFLFTRSRAA